eukprot:TRINITY_DN1028_c0_g1_i1.p1 TRINITY_DN1028_c0_g1~~TRINITY_DN1028_c0_g1_i1.p1  ORF type:complete len:1242 (+),score=350.36 TRINITY_DN1028_c0_g1_i1:187-3726(+)
METTAEQNGSSEQKQVDTSSENGVVPQESEIESFFIFVKTLEHKDPIKLQVNPHDNIQDIRGFLLDSPETCHHTCYSLFLDGKKLPDFSDLSDISEVKADSLLEMKEAHYDERAIRLHVRHLRDLLNITSPQYEPQVSPAVFTRISATEDVEETQQESSLPKVQTPNLSHFYGEDTTAAAPVHCLKNVHYSGWNPVPAYRKLNGDLIYLEATTLEGKTFHITGWTNGFFVNQSSSSQFEPQQSDKSPQSHTLVGLFSQISPLFKKHLNQLLSKNVERNPYEVLPVLFPVTPWVVGKSNHSFDLLRSEDTPVSGLESELPGQLREWNEEYQIYKDLPRETIQERIYRDRNLTKFNAEFVDAATKAACAIIEKAIPPINPMEPEKSHMYIYNNIFFSYATDGRDIFKDCGGDRAAYMSINNDLKGIRAYNRADIKGLHTLATAIIDYRGHRLCAQSIIPGILQREGATTVIYGSVDTGKKIVHDAAFHELLTAAGKALFIKEHTVSDNEDGKVTLCTPVEAKGIVGTDSRKYILDLVRTTPRDANFIGPEHSLTVLRPELLSTYYDYKMREKRNEKEEAKKAEQPAENSEVNGKSEAKPAEQQPLEDFPFALNPNVFCEQVKSADTPEEIKRDEDEVKAVSKFLLDTAIPLLLEEFSYFLSVPVDGESLTSVMHLHGINLRYLGLIGRLSQENPVMKELVLREMITRAGKHTLKKLLRESEPFNLAKITSQFLNCFVGEVHSNKATPKKNGKQAPTPQELDAETLSSAAVWNQVVYEVKQRYNYDLPSRESLRDVIKCLPTVRSICQKVGIQLEARQYNLTAPSPFQPANILRLFPLVKHFNHECTDGINLLAVGKSFLAQGRLDLAFEWLNEALAIFSSVYGPLHRDTASCYRDLALVLFNAKDTNQALDHQQKATIISERVLGLDHYETSQNYLQLASFYQHLSKTPLALKLIKRSLYLNSLMTSPSHPDIATTFTNIAMMLQDLSRHQDAISYLNEAVKSYEAILGSNHIHTSPLYHAIAMAHSNLGQFKEALAFEKKNYGILSSKLGESDMKTVESNIWLKQFTAKAVQHQIETNKAQRDLASSLSHAMNSKIKGFTNPNPSNERIHLGSRSLNEILSYINGKTSEPKSFAQRNRVEKRTEDQNGGVQNGHANSQSSKNSKKKKSTGGNKKQSNAAV